MNDRDRAYKFMVENFDESWLTPTPMFGKGKTSNLIKKYCQILSSLTDEQAVSWLYINHDVKITSAQYRKLKG